MRHKTNRTDKTKRLASTTAAPLAEPEQGVVTAGPDLPAIPDVAPTTATSAATKTPTAPGRRCDTCGNVYDKSFQVTTPQRTYVFDSLECAAHAMAPRCSHCSCRILGHGVEADGSMYCCAHCAKASGEAGLKDRA